MASAWSVQTMPAVTLQPNSLFRHAELGQHPALGFKVLDHYLARDESGVPRFDAASWYAVLAPARTPKTAVALLSKEIVRIMNTPEVRQRFANDGFEPAGTSPAELSKFLRTELAKWAKAVEMAGIKPE